MDEKELGSVNISVPCNYLPINKKISHDIYKSQVQMRSTTTRQVKKHMKYDAWKADISYTAVTRILLKIKFSFK